MEMYVPLVFTAALFTIVQRWELRVYKETDTNRQWGIIQL